MPQLSKAELAAQKQQNVLISLVPPELPAPLAIEVLTAFESDALVMFALHNARMKDTVIKVMDETLKSHGITDVTGVGLIDLLERSIERAVSQASP